MTEQILNYLSSHILCTMATVTPDGKPEAALVGFRCNDQLEFLIGTSNLSRKYHNLQSRPHVAIVVGDTVGEVQYEGDARVIDGAEYDECIASGRFAALPGADKYRQDPTQVYLIISPTWLRFIQHGEQDQITEMTDFYEAEV